MFVNFILKATKIIGQRKAFYRQRIPGSSCARKETDRHFVTFGDRITSRLVRQSVRITSRPPSRLSKWNQFSQVR